MDEATPLDTALDACGHKHRRIVLATLANRDQPVSINDLTNAVVKHNHHTPPTEIDNETAKRVHVGLHQAHLPNLAKTGFIKYDRERKVAELTATVGQEDSYLSEILAMDSELPATQRRESCR